MTGISFIALLNSSWKSAHLENSLRSVMIWTLFLFSSRNWRQTTKNWLNRRLSVEVEVLWFQQSSWERDKEKKWWFRADFKCCSFQTGDSGHEWSPRRCCSTTSKRQKRSGEVNWGISRRNETNRSWMSIDAMVRFRTHKPGLTVFKWRKESKNRHSTLWHFQVAFHREVGVGW